MKSATGIKEKKYSAAYWNSEITLAKERHKKFWEFGKESIGVYNTNFQHKELVDIQRKLNAWWYLVQSLLPAYFSSTPKAEVNLRKRAGGSIYQLTSVILERDIQYSLEEDFDFDTVGYNSALQFLLTGRGVLWARYDADFEPQQEGIVDENGNPYEKKTGERAILDVVQYDDYLNSDARNESEIEWRARRAYLSEEQATDKFGSDTANKLSYTAFPEALNRNNMKGQTLYDGKAEVWEVWCEEANKVFWLQGNGGKTVLESGEPPLNFKDFYPCEVINATIDPESTIPTSDYVHCRDQIIEVERLTTRIHAITQAIRPNGAYDATLGKDLELIMTGDLKMIPITNWPAYKQRGGLASSIEMMQIDSYINALQVITQARETALEKLYEITKASDLLRGVSDPTKTATANRLENAWSSLGLIVRQNQFAQFIGKAIGKLGVIIATQFSPETILERGDALELISPLISTQQDPNQPPIDPQIQIQQIQEQIIAICKNETELCYHIKIASDSMVALDERQERQDGVDLMQSAGGFFDQMKGMIEAYPPLAEFAVELLKNVVRRYKGGKELEGLFTKALQEVATISQQKMAQASQQPPDPKMMEMQAKLQIAQQESQTRVQLAQMEGQIKQQEAQAELQKVQQESQLEMWKAQQDMAIRMKDLDIKANAVQVELLKVQATTSLEAANQGILQEQTRLAAIIDQQKIEIEKAHAMIAAHDHKLNVAKFQELEIPKTKTEVNQMKLPKENATKL